MAKVSRVKAVRAVAEQKTSAGSGVPSGANQATLGTPRYWERSFVDKRTPMVVTSTHWLRTTSKRPKKRYIILYVNPSEISWSMGKRETVTKTAAGAIRNAWRNRFRNTYYDEPILNITFQTGNLMPGAGIPNAVFQNSMSEYATAKEIINNPPVPPGLQNFYDFLGLVDQPMLASGNRENRHILMYRTRVFPRMHIEGYFTGDPITFTESADAGNSLTWNASFMVYRTDPRFQSSAALAGAFSDAVRSHGGMKEIVPSYFDMGDFQAYLGERGAGVAKDSNLPYKQLKLDSQSGRKKKKVGLVTPPSGKSATPKRSTSASSNVENQLAADNIQEYQRLTDNNINATNKILADYKAPGGQPGATPGQPGVHDVSIRETTYGPGLEAAIKYQFSAERGTLNNIPPPTTEEINLFAASWLRQNMDTADQARYDVLLHRLENP